MTEENYNYRTSQTLLRNQFPGKGKLQIPIIPKFQERPGDFDDLLLIGFDKTQVYTTMELRMKCGVGKCGRCNIGSKYVCKDGPVFRCDEIDEMPDEY